LETNFKKGGGHRGLQHSQDGLHWDPLKQWRSHDGAGRCLGPLQFF